MFRGWALLVLGAALGGAGCVTRVDMASVYDQGSAATTIPYSGVRGGRQFPDYQPIGGSILTGKDPGGEPAAGKPRGGSK